MAFANFSGEDFWIDAGAVAKDDRPTHMVQNIKATPPSKKAIGKWTNIGWSSQAFGKAMSSSIKG